MSYSMDIKPFIDILVKIGHVKNWFHVLFRSIFRMVISKTDLFIYYYAYSTIQKMESFAEIQEFQMKFFGISMMMSVLLMTYSYYNTQNKVSTDSRLYIDVIVKLSKCLQTNPDFIWMEKYGGEHIYNTLQTLGYSLTLFIDWSTDFIQLSISLIIQIVVFIKASSIGYVELFFIGIIMIVINIILYKLSKRFDNIELTDKLSKMSSNVKKENLNLFKSFQDRTIHRELDSMLNSYENNDVTLAQLRSQVRTTNYLKYRSIWIASGFITGITTILVTYFYKGSVKEYLIFYFIEQTMLIQISSGIGFVITQLSEFDQVKEKFEESNEIIHQITKQQNNVDIQPYPFSNNTVIDVLPFSAVLTNGKREYEVKSTNSIKIHPKDRVIVKGESGHGKSTFVKMLFGIVEQSKGGLCLDDLYYQSFAGIQSYITYHRQDALSFVEGTIMQIITGIPNVIPTNEMIWMASSALQLAQISYEFSVNSTEIYDRSNTSGGQQSRLNLAHVLYLILTTNRQIIILDEIDKGISKQLADKMYHALFTRFTDKTIIVIAHHEPSDGLFNHTIRVENGVVSEIEEPLLIFEDIV